MPRRARSSAAWITCWPKLWKASSSLTPRATKPPTLSGGRQWLSTVPRLRDQSSRENGKLDPATWPNTGIGRLNPDGSRGSCSACHLRHNFSRAQARAPENCGRCHLGPDHPQKEVYDESKHGIAFYANRSRFEPMMEEKEWIPGRDFRAGPDLHSLPHGPDQEPAAYPRRWRAHQLDAAPAGLGEDRRGGAQGRQPGEELGASAQGHEGTSVDPATHTEWVENWYVQYDNAVELYNDKFGRPSTELFKMAGAEGLLTSVQFDEELEFTYFFLWHHEGRRARHGVAMMGPDYTQWHGFYEVAHRFYMEFVPQLREVISEGGGTAREPARPGWKPG